MLAEFAEAAPAPARFVAVTVNTYDVLFAKPDTEIVPDVA
jgi:hypothetical protein